MAESCHHNEHAQGAAAAQLLQSTAALSTTMPIASPMLEHVIRDDMFASVPCAPLGWTSIFDNRQSECIASPTANHMTSAIAAVQQVPLGHVGHIKAEPHCFQFDRDANGELV